MKMKLSITIIVLLCAIFQPGAGGTAIADYNVYNYTEIKQQMLDFEKSDGYKAEGITHFLEMAFMNSPKTFLKAILEMEPSNQEHIIFHITAYPYGGDDKEFNTFRNVLIMLKDSSLKAKQTEIVNRMLQTFEDYGYKEFGRTLTYGTLPTDSISGYFRIMIPGNIMGNYQRSIYRDEFIALIINAYQYSRSEVADFSSPFIDINDSLYKASIEKAYTLDIINGTSTSTFSPQLALTKEQAAKILCGLLSAVSGEELEYGYLPDYSDQSDISAWAIPYVGYCQQYKIMTEVNEDRFHPKDEVSCEAAMLLVQRLIA